VVNSLAILCIVHISTCSWFGQWSVLCWCEHWCSGASIGVSLGMIEGARMLLAPARVVHLSTIFSQVARNTKTVADVSRISSTPGCDVTRQHRPVILYLRGRSIIAVGSNGTAGGRAVLNEINNHRGAHPHTTRPSS
jgi:hypothetical protein